MGPRPTQAVRNCIICVHPFIPVNDGELTCHQMECKLREQRGEGRPVA